MTSSLFKEPALTQQNEIGNQAQYLTFFVSDEEYAIGILRVKEIIVYDTVTRVPKTPAFIRGVINLRDGAVPIVDLAMKFGLAEATITRSSCIVIVELDLDGGKTVVGLLVDAVQQVIELSASDIEPPPQFGLQTSINFITGMARAGKKFVLLLDIDCVLGAEDVAEAVATTAADEAEPPGTSEVAEETQAS